MLSNVDATSRQRRRSFYSSPPFFGHIPLLAVPCVRANVRFSLSFNVNRRQRRVSSALNELRFACDVRIISAGSLLALQGRCVRGVSAWFTRQAHLPCEGFHPGVVILSKKLSIDVIKRERCAFMQALTSSRLLVARLPFDLYAFKSCAGYAGLYPCLLYTSPSPRDKRQSRMPSSA